MLQDIPVDVRQGVNSILKSRGKIEFLNFSFSTGGCINQGGKLSTSTGDFYLKWNDAEKFPAMFQAEAKGLQLLQRGNEIDIPKVIGFGEEGSYQFLILAFIRQIAPSKNYWKILGRQLAELHRRTDELFGLDHPNYIGSLRQFNDPNSSWINFFIEHRLNVQLKLAIDAGRIDSATSKSFEKFYLNLPSLLPEEKPSLLHGDLWHGNLLCSESGNPCLIDPAVYYGSRETDLAMTRLFGAFSVEFYKSYEEHFPLLPGHAQRVDIYNLYPLLVHLNLFGPEYLIRIVAILKSFV